MLLVGSKYDEFGCMPVALEFALDSYSGPAWEVRPLRFRSGWLRVSRATMETPVSTWSAPLVACIDDGGEPLSGWLTSKLFEMRCSLPREAEDIPPVELEEITDGLYWDFLGTCDLKHLAMIEEREAQVAAKIARLESRGTRIALEVDSYVTALRRSLRRGEFAPEEQDAVVARITLLVEKLTAAEIWLRNRTAAIREEANAFEEDILDTLQLHGQVEHLYWVQWRVRTVRERRADPELQPRGWWPNEQKIAPPIYLDPPSPATYQRLRWRGLGNAASERDARPQKVSYENRESDRVVEVSRKTAALSNVASSAGIGLRQAKQTQADTRRAEAEFQRALATTKVKRQRDTDAFLANMEQKRAHALRQREKRAAYQLRKALAEQAELEAMSGSHSTEPSGERALANDDRGNNKTAQALQVALEKQRSARSSGNT